MLASCIRYNTQTETYELSTTLLSLKQIKALNVTDAVKPRKHLIKCTEDNLEVYLPIVTPTWLIPSGKEDLLSEYIDVVCANYVDIKSNPSYGKLVVWLFSSWLDTYPEVFVKAIMEHVEHCYYNQVSKRTVGGSLVSIVNLNKSTLETIPLTVHANKTIYEVEVDLFKRNVAISKDGKRIWEETSKELRSCIDKSMALTHLLAGLEV